MRKLFLFIVLLLFGTSVMARSIELGLCSGFANETCHGENVSTDSSIDCANSTIGADRAVSTNSTGNHGDECDCENHFIHCCSNLMMNTNNSDSYLLASVVKEKLSSNLFVLRKAPILDGPFQPPKV